MKTILGGGLLLISGYLFKINLYPSRLTKDETDTLRVFFDVLIPGDESPPASALNVDKILISEIEQDKTLLLPARKTCKWLNALSNSSFNIKSFKLLDDANRQKIAGIASESTEGTVQRFFFDTTLRKALSHYYANPASWSSLRYNGPPQPNGFPEQSEAPVQL
ncbi:MAG: gluconate 2-dehydrogenase subunit 3 family protein [Nitrospirae bacterium YQR-1]